LRAKLRNPAFRHIEGFPEGDEAAILDLSDPPYYTACPNPFLTEFLAAERDDSAPPAASPFAADLRIGRHDPYSLAHTYHTKVSPLAIVQYVQHFTRPGDVVLDFFCGSGMTGLAAAGADLNLLEGRPYLSGSQPRRAVLIDLCPAATHIAAGHATRITADELDAVRDVLDEVRRAEKVIFAVNASGTASRREAWAAHFGVRSSQRLAELEYLVWSEVLICRECGRDTVFGTSAYDVRARRVHETFPCPHCRAPVHKRRCSRRMEEYVDPLLGIKTLRPRLKPLFTAHRAGGRRLYRHALPGDEGPHPTCDPAALPPARPVLYGERFYKDALRDAYGITHIHHFYTLRNLRALSSLLAAARRTPARVTRLLRFLVSSIAIKASKLMNYNADGVGRVLKGTLYGSSLVQECNPFWLAEIALKDLTRFARASRHHPRHILISTQSAAGATLPEASVDYVWIDPPFGKSLMYAELNQLWEWWHGVHTAAEQEAVVDVRRGKDLAAYTDILTRCLAQAHRALKPGRWMTIAFHNSESAVWNAIQQAVRRAGFVLADVRILDKRLLTYKQSQQGLARVDLVLSAYKPQAGMQNHGQLKEGSAAEAWRFVRRHLARLAMPVEGTAVMAERTCHWLFDRMVAHHLRRGVAVPLSAPEFFAGLRERFVERDGMYFLKDAPAPSSVHG
jgi:16S rRNA G966 N2-methylase RsmD